MYQRESRKTQLEKVNNALKKLKKLNGISQDFTLKNHISVESLERYTKFFEEYQKIPDALPNNPSEITDYNELTSAVNHMKENLSRKLNEQLNQLNLAQLHENFQNFSQTINKSIDKTNNFVEKIKKFKPDFELTQKVTHLGRLDENPPQKAFNKICGILNDTENTFDAVLANYNTVQLLLNEHAEGIRQLQPSALEARLTEFRKTEEHNNAKITQAFKEILEDQEKQYKTMVNEYNTTLDELQNLTQESAGSTISGYPKLVPLENSTSSAETEEKLNCYEKQINEAARKLDILKKNKKEYKEAYERQKEIEKLTGVTRQKNNISSISLSTLIRDTKTWNENLKPLADANQEFESVADEFETTCRSATHILSNDEKSKIIVKIKKEYNSTNDIKTKIKILNQGKEGLEYEIARIIKAKDKSEEKAKEEIKAAERKQTKEIERLNKAEEKKQVREEEKQRKLNSEKTNASNKLKLFITSTHKEIEHFSTQLNAIKESVPEKIIESNDKFLNDIKKEIENLENDLPRLSITDLEKSQTELKSKINMLQSKTKTLSEIAKAQDALNTIDVLSEVNHQDEISSNETYLQNLKIKYNKIKSSQETHKKEQERKEKHQKEKAEKEKEKKIKDKRQQLEKTRKEQREFVTTQIGELKKNRDLLEKATDKIKKLRTTHKEITDQKLLLKDEIKTIDDNIQKLETTQKELSQSYTLKEIEEEYMREKTPPIPEVISTPIDTDSLSKEVEQKISAADNAIIEFRDKLKTEKEKLQNSIAELKKNLKDFKKKSKFNGKGDHYEAYKKYNQEINQIYAELTGGIFSPLARLLSGTAFENFTPIQTFIQHSLPYHEKSENKLKTLKESVNSIKNKVDGRIIYLETLNKGFIETENHTLASDLLHQLESDNPRYYALNRFNSQEILWLESLIGTELTKSILLIKKSFTVESTLGMLATFSPDRIYNNTAFTKEEISKISNKLEEIINNNTDFRLLEKYTINDFLTLKNLLRKNLPKHELIHEYKDYKNLAFTTKEISDIKNDLEILKGKNPKLAVQIQTLINKLPTDKNNSSKFIEKAKELREKLITCQENVIQRLKEIQKINNEVKNSKAREAHQSSSSAAIPQSANKHKPAVNSTSEQKEHYLQTTHMQSLRA